MDSELTLPVEKLAGLSNRVASFAGARACTGKRLTAATLCFRCGPDQELVRLAPCITTFLDLYNIRFTEDEISDWLRKVHAHFNLTFDASTEAEPQSRGAADAHSNLTFDASTEAEAEPQSRGAAVAAEVTEVARLRTQVARLTKVVKSGAYWKSRCEKLKVENDELKATIRSHRQGVKRGAARRYFSTRGGLATALKRCMTNTASYSAGIFLEEDVSGTSVRKWEIKLRASMIVSFRFFQMRNCQALEQVNPYCTGMKFMVQRFRCDATNVLWKKNKLHVLELQSSYLPEAIPATAAPEEWQTTFEPLVETRKCLAELQVVRGTGHARGMLGMIEAQMKTLRAPVWSEPMKSQKLIAVGNGSRARAARIEDAGMIDVSADPAVLALAPFAEPGVENVPQCDADDAADVICSVFIATSDNGSDIHGGRELVAKQVSGIPNSFFFDGDCLAHQYHLITGDLLYSMDEIVMRELDEQMKYYSNLAALCHVLRDNHSEIYSFYRTNWPDGVKDSAVWKICPRPLSGRWGRKTSCETYVLRIDPFNLTTALREVLKATVFCRETVSPDRKGPKPPPPPLRPFRPPFLPSPPGVLFCIAGFWFPLLKSKGAPPSPPPPP